MKRVVYLTVTDPYGMKLSIRAEVEAPNGALSQHEMDQWRRRLADRLMEIPPGLPHSNFSLSGVRVR